MIQRDLAPALAKLALQLLNITANSVASERAFSTMNFLQSKLRNRLTIETMDKLCFIYINQRSLRGVRGKIDKELEDQLVTDMLLNLEDNIVQMDGEGVISE
jgi:hypothetical protein